MDTKSGTGDNRSINFNLLLHTEAIKHHIITFAADQTYDALIQLQKIENGHGIFYHI